MPQPLDTSLTLRGVIQFGSGPDAPASWLDTGLIASIICQPIKWGGGVDGKWKDRLALAKEGLLTTRSLALGAGVALVSVPTVFTVFPGFTSWPVGIRAAIVAVWVLTAWLAVQSTLRQTSQVDQLVGPALEKKRKSAEVATIEILRAVLGSPGFPEHYQFRLFVPDLYTGKLLSSFDPSGGIAGASGWEFNHGVTGKAYTSRSYQVARGPQCCDAAMWGLTPAQVERAQAFKVIAAQPVMNDTDDVIGVLTASSEQEDDGALVTSDGVLRHLLLTEIVNRVLSDVFPEPRS